MVDFLNIAFYNYINNQIHILLAFKLNCNIEFTTLK